jgi:sterol desaturase/sphingolipid hydroxylase (fatty acid hydroxylase superfamily)
MGWIWLTTPLLLGASELLGYIWHRFGAHADLVPGVHDTHRIHHREQSPSGDEDFLLLLLVVTLSQVAAGLLVLVIGRGRQLLTWALGVTLLNFWCSWWLHRAFHQEGHWLEQYPWFLEARKEHQVHHQSPTKNYGIATRWWDWVGGTWKAPSS